MGLYESYEEDISRSPSSPLVITCPEEAKKLFDDPTYISNKKPVRLRVMRGVLKGVGGAEGDERSGWG